MTAGRVPPIRRGYLLPRNTRMNADSVIKPPTMGIAGINNRGCAATTISATTPIIAAPAGNHLAGRCNEGQANHNAIITNPMRPQAAAAKLPELPSVNHHASNDATSNVTPATNAINRRISLIVHRFSPAIVSCLKFKV